MNQSDLEALLSELDPDERADAERQLAAVASAIWTPLPGPQTVAFESEADVIGFGGAAGGGKTDLSIGKALLKHRKAFVVRSNGTEHSGMIDRLTEMLGTRDGYSSRDGIWRDAGPRKVQIEFGSLPNPKDEEKYRGRPHDLVLFDEVTSILRAQVEFLMAWNRTTTPGQKCQTILTFNPPRDATGRWVIEYFAPWLDKKHPNPALPGELRYFAAIDGKDTEVPDGDPFVLIDGERVYDFDPTMHKADQVITPKSRTFIPSRVTDNPYLIGTGYLAQLQALREPIRSQMLYGDFNAGVSDDAFQVIPTAWVQAAMDRWTDLPKKPPMDALGVDVARGGADNTVLARRHGMWFDKPLAYPGKETRDGPSVAALAIAAARDGAVINIDVIGVGSSPYDFLVDANQDVVGVNVSEASAARDKAGRMGFYNKRTELIWRMAEALDPAANTGICLPPDPRLLSDLCAFTWKISGGKYQVESTDEVKERIGRSPDYASAYCLALIDGVKRIHLPWFSKKAHQITDYNPFDTALKVDAAKDYDPFSTLERR